MQEIFAQLHSSNRTETCDGEGRYDKCATHLTFFFISMFREKMNAFHKKVTLVSLRVGKMPSPRRGYGRSSSAARTLVNISEKISDKVEHFDQHEGIIQEKGDTDQRLICSYSTWNILSIQQHFHCDVCRFIHPERGGKIGLLSSIPLVS